MPSRFILPLLTLFQLTIYVVLVVCLNQSQIFTVEETHSAFVDVVFFENRLQASQFATNFASYLVFWLGFQAFPSPDLFYARAIKALVMSSCAPLVYCLLHLRFAQPRLFSLLTAIAVGTVPGVYFYSVLGIDIGLELPFGLLALLLASYGNPLSGAVLAFSCLCYGAGFSFALPVLWLLSRHPRPIRRILWATLYGAITVLIPILYVKNLQLLFLGGGDSHLPWLISSKVLYRDLLLGWGSYYYPLQGHPALGAFYLGWIGIVGCAWFALQGEKHRLWVLLAVSSLAIGIVSGDPPGTRRIIPFVAASTILGSLLLQIALAKWPRVHLAIGLFAILALGYDMAKVANIWRKYHALLPTDFQLIGPGQSMEESLEAYRLRLATIPAGIPNARPHYAIVHLLTAPDPVVTFDQVFHVPDPADLPIPASAPRFSMTGAILRHRTSPTSSVAK